METNSVIIGKLEERSDSINEKHLKSESKLKWLSEKKFQNYGYRVVFEGDNPKQNHAIYLTEWKEALKIRDFSIVSAISDQKNNGINPKNFVKYYANHWKALHSYKILKLIKLYVEEENKEQEKLNKLMAKDQERKMEMEKINQELLKKKQEEDMKNHERQKIIFLRKSEFLHDLPNEYLKKFAQFWLSMAKNIQNIYLKSKPGNFLIFLI